MRQCRFIWSWTGSVSFSMGLLKNMQKTTIDRKLSQLLVLIYVGGWSLSLRKKKKERKEMRDRKKETMLWVLWKKSSQETLFLFHSSL